MGVLCMHMHMHTFADNSHIAVRRSVFHFQLETHLQQCCIYCAHVVQHSNTPTDFQGAKIAHVIDTRGKKIKVACQRFQLSSGTVNNRAVPIYVHTPVTRDSLLENTRASLGFETPLPLPIIIARFMHRFLLKTQQYKQQCDCAKEKESVAEVGSYQPFPVEQKIEESLE